MDLRYQADKINPSRYSKSQIKYFLILIPLAAFYSLPIIYILVTAFKPLAELFAYPPRFFVQNPTLDNFRQLVDTMASSTVPFVRYLLNSLISTVIAMIVSVLISLYAGYTLAKKKFRFSRVLSNINTMALMFVPVAVTIPRYLVLEKLGIVNTFAALILPLVAMPVGLFLLKQFISDVPDSLIESAKIDGAAENTIVWRIIAPIVRPALATVAILAFQLSWNAVEPSSLFINSDQLKTFPFFMSVLMANQGNLVAGAGMVAASSLIMFVPNLVIFIFMQSKVLNTMAHSGIK